MTVYYQSVAAWPQAMQASIVWAGPQARCGK